MVRLTLVLAALALGLLPLDIASAACDTTHHYAAPLTGAVATARGTTASPWLAVTVSQDCSGVPNGSGEWGTGIGGGFYRADHVAVQPPDGGIAAPRFVVADDHPLLAPHVAFYVGVDKNGDGDFDDAGDCLEGALVDNAIPTVCTQPSGGPVSALDGWWIYLPAHATLPDGITSTPTTGTITTEDWTQ